MVRSFFSASLYSHLFYFFFLFLLLFVGVSRILGVHSSPLLFPILVYTYTILCAKLMKTDYCYIGSLCLLHFSVSTRQ